MNLKTKKKIEAMADDYFLNCGGDSPNIDTACAAQNLSDGYVKGANPWAEWCERFVEHLEMCDNDADKEWIVLHNEKMVKEYRSWLEEQ